MTSIDLLLMLGGKIADVLLSLLGKKATDKEKENAKNLIQQYQELNEAHTKISSVLQRYNHGLVHAVATRSLQELAILCTQNGFEHVESLYHSYVKQGISPSSLEQLEVLSINLANHKVQEVKFSSSNETTHQSAQAYTSETWVSHESDSSSRFSENVINRYWLLLEDSMWKIDKVEVFVKS